MDPWTELRSEKFARVERNWRPNGAVQEFSLAMSRPPLVTQFGLGRLVQPPVKVRSAPGHP